MDKVEGVASVVGDDKVSAICRFVAKVEKTEGCWNWSASRFPSGYGRFAIGSTRADKQIIGAHRASWILFRGPIPVGQHVLHRCDNPGCVNPRHLFLGTAADNVRDCITKGRARRNQTGKNLLVRGELHGNSRLTEEVVRLIRASTDPTKVLADQFGVSRAHVWSIRKGKAWRHVGDEGVAS